MSTLSAVMLSMIICSSPAKENVCNKNYNIEVAGDSLRYFYLKAKVDYSDSINGIKYISHGYSSDTTFGSLSDQIQMDSGIWIFSILPRRDMDWEKDISTKDKLILLRSPLCCEWIQNILTRWEVRGGKLYLQKMILPSLKTSYGN